MMVRLNVELFPLHPKSTDLLLDGMKLKLIKYVAYFEKDARLVLQEQRSRYLHLLLQIEQNGGSIGTLIEEKDGFKILLLDEPKQTKYYAFGNDDSDDFLMTIEKEAEYELDPFQKDFDVFSEILKKKIFNRLYEKGYSIEGGTALKKREILSDVRLKHQIEDHPLLKYHATYQGYKFRLRNILNQIYLQVIPEAKLYYERSLALLMSEDGYNIESLVDYFPNVRLETGRYANLIAIIKNLFPYTPISRELSLAFNGRNFQEFQKKVYKGLRDANPFAPMVVIKPSGLGGSKWYFSSDLVFPSLNYQDYSRYHAKYFGDLVSALKARSPERNKMIRAIIDDLNDLEVFGIPISFIKAGFNRNESPVSIGYSNLLQKSNLPSLIKFKTPSILIRQKSKEEEMKILTEPFEIHAEGAGKYMPFVSSLLSNDDLAPLGPIPPIFRVFVIYEKDLHQEYQTFKKAFIRGISGYRGFKETFCADLEWKEDSINSFIDENEDILSAEYKKTVRSISTQSNCVILLMNKNRRRQYLRSYTEPKRTLLEKGIPVQVLLHDRRGAYNNLITNCKQPEFLFNFGLNILEKAGVRVFKIGPTTKKCFLPLSIVIGYNITRIIPKREHLIQKEEIAKKIPVTIPLVVPLIIIGNEDEIRFMNKYETSSEVSLFEEFGQEIFEQIPSNLKNVVIHKDGPFKESELQDLESFALNGMRIIPISIVRHQTPRFTIGEEAPRAGFVVKMSNNDFIMTTTMVGRSRIEAFGWPRPIWIRFHDHEINQEQPLNDKERLKVLFQIFCMTKLHAGALKPTRLPISIHYPNMISKLLKKMSDPDAEFLDEFIKESEHGLIKMLWL